MVLNILIRVNIKTNWGWNSGRKGKMKQRRGRRDTVSKEKRQGKEEQEKKR